MMRVIIAVVFVVVGSGVVVKFMKNVVHTFPKELCFLLNLFWMVSETPWFIRVPWFHTVFQIDRQTDSQTVSQASVSAIEIAEAGVWWCCDGVNTNKPCTYLFARKGNQASCPVVKCLSLSRSGMGMEWVL